MRRDYVWGKRSAKKIRGFMIRADEFYERLGSAIKARREALSLTQSDLAARLGLSRTSITNIERGRQRLLIDQFCRLAEILRCERDALLIGLSQPGSSRRPRASSTDAMSATVADFVESLGNDKRGQP